MLLDKKELADKVFVVFALIVAWIHNDKLMTKVNAQARVSTKTAVALLGALRFWNDSGSCDGDETQSKC